jgi:hypothetical protein
VQPSARIVPVENVAYPDGDFVVPRLERYMNSNARLPELYHAAHARVGDKQRRLPSLRPATSGLLLGARAATSHSFTRLPDGVAVMAVVAVVAVVTAMAVVAQAAPP